MKIGNMIGRNRWFVLGLMFLGLNGYAVWLYHGALEGRRGLRVEMTAPRDGRVAERDWVRWRFSGEMIPAGATGEWSALGPVKFTPAVKGAFQWVTPRELVFRPDENWRLCTDFKAAFGADLRSADLRPLEQAPAFEFHSDSLAFNGVSQVDWPSDNDVRLQLEFNAEVAPEQVAKALSITNASGQNVAFSVVPLYRNWNKNVQIGLDPGSWQELTLNLPAGLQSPAGPRGLERAVTYKIRPMRELRVVKIEPEMVSFGPQSIIVSFNRQILLESAADFVKVGEPALPVTVEAVCHWRYNSGNSLRIVGDFKPNRSYAVTLRKGLPARGGASLAEDITRNVYFPDAEPALAITAEGHYLSPRGNLLLPFRTIGMTKYHVTLRRVYPNNLVYLTRRAERSWYYDPEDGLAHDVMEKDGVIAKNPNEIVEQRLALRELIGDQRGAFYVAMSATDGQRSQEARHHVVVSDIGLSARKSDNEILVWANSLRTLAPVTGATVKVFSAENQELQAGLTDVNGLVRLPVATNAPGGAPYLVTAQLADGDLTYLELAGTAVEVKGSVGARPFLAAGYEAYLFTDRGIYRPGETAHVKAIVRGIDAACPPAFPVQLKILRPDGRLDKTLSAMLTELGTAEFAIPWPDFAATGNYRLELALPGDKKALGTTQVALEEFVPPQIRVAVKTAPDRARAGEEIRAEVQSDYLFGRPAAGLAAEVRVEFLPEPVKFENFPGFAFGDARKKFQNVRQAVGKEILDADGRAGFKLKASAEWRPPAALKAIILGSVLEIGGRSVTAYASRSVDVYPFYLGLKCGPADIQTGREHVFEAVAVAPTGGVAAGIGRLKLTVEKLVWTTILRRGSGNEYNYCSEQQASRVSAGEVEFKDGKAAIPFTPASDGEYRLALADPKSGASAALEFHASAPGQSWATRSMEAPDAVELKFDKERYVAGETATLLIKAPFPGKALVTLEATNILSQQVLTLDKNTAELKFPVRREYAPNVYCCVTLIRPAVYEKLWGQHRAAGQIPLIVDAPEKKFKLTLNAPEAIRPNQKLEVAIEVAAGATGSVPAEVVVAAVDEGICLLTDFKTPDPYGFFLAPRLPGGRLCDLYALLMPELEKTIDGEASSPGGDDAMAGLGKRLNPIKSRRFKPVALWSGTCLTDAQGRARVSFEVPEFTGQLRLMAVAVDKQGFAAAEKKVAVARPLVVQSSLPRFLAPADKCDLAVQIMNETGQGGEAAVRVACAGPLVCDNGATSVLRRIVLEKGAATNFAIGLAAQVRPGQAVCRLEVALAGEQFAEETELAVRPPAGRIAVTGNGRLAPGQTAAVAVPANWLEQTGETEVWLDSLPAVELGGSLNYLLNYPYGCLEQTTSKSFPLLYLRDLAEQTQPGWLDRKEVANFVQAGIQRILTMQRDDGSFSLWRGEPTYPWGSIYATHFLVEAAQAGYPVPEERLKAAGDFLEQWLARKKERVDGGVPEHTAYDQAYACYVLARAGRPQSGWMIRLREQEAKLDYDTRINLAAALLAAGKRREGHALLGSLESAAPGKLPRESAGSLRSVVKANALLLSAWLEADPENAAIPGLVQRLEAGRERGIWYTTQENAMALMALGKYCNRLARDRKPISGRVGWRGLRLQEFSAQREYRAALGPGAGGQVEIRNEGQGAIYYCWKSEGVPADGAMPEEDRGLKVRRQLLDLAGKSVAGAQLPQGELFVVEVTLETDNLSAENIVVQDLLPAGLEIENANLKTSQTVSWCKEKQTLALAHTDVRDDRLVVFAGPFAGGKAYTYYYAVRAVTPGEFVWPAIRADCMYDPAARSAHGVGKIRVVGGL